MSTVKPPFTDLLVPLDGSPAAERAIAPAVELARRTRVPLRLMRQAYSDDIDDAIAYLATVARRRAAGVDVETQVLDRESVPNAILDARHQETLVCMSSHGRGGLTRAMIGSFTEAVLRSVDRPVLVVGPHVHDGAAFAGHVTACIDASRSSELTLEPARAWAALLGRPLWLVSVARPTPPSEFPADGALETGVLGRFARQIGGVDGWDVYHGRDVAHELADRTTSDDDPVALLVMATHGRTGWDRLRLGSVTAATIQAAAVPVLVVPAASAAANDAGSRDREGASRP
jgi:nucleotide-binding universal stress UspA family protein